MFRHKGKNRTHKHNLRLAAILSFIAGMVNTSGVLSIKTLTTNVTGHFAFFAEELVKKSYSTAFIFLLYILFFLLGAFVSNMLVEITSRIKPRISHALPMLIEIMILTMIGLYGSSSGMTGYEYCFIACTLLFAMGMQNALVTKISQSTVRTTHLTGLFTDLGIELSQLFFYREIQERQKLNKSIFLRFVIIAFFFIGCVLDGFLYQAWQLKTLLLAAGCLTLALFYDTIRYRYYITIRKFR
ncbi:MAG: rane protein [Bacteroidetes bacterium]|nr:rane protein [Bacteroidota bacterium]